MSVILESANRINALKSAVEAVTGQSYDNLTQGIQALKDGYSTSEVEGIQYTDIIYNDDDTVTLIDTNGNEHIIACTYENNRLMSMTYDGKEVMTVYDHGDLVAVGETEVNVVNAPLDSTLENLIDESGVLDSTDGTATEKINKVLKMAKWKNYIQQGLYFRPNTRHLIFADIDNPDILDLDFSKQTVLSDTFRGNPSLEEFIMDLSIVTEVSAFLAESPNLKKVVLTNTQGVKSWPNAFSGCGKLVSIETLNLSGATSVARILANCNSLETIKIVPETIKISIVIMSPVLSDESIQSIIDGLATVETAQTLTLHKNTKILQSQVDSANAKGWTVAGGTVVSEEEYYG